MNSSRTPYIITCVASLALAAVATVGYVQKKREAEAMRLDFDGRTSALQKEMAQMSLRVAELQAAAEKRIETMIAGTSETADKEKAEESAEKKQKNPLATLMKGLGELLKSKEAQAGMRELTKGAMNSQFKDLFDLLELDDAKKEAVTELLSAAESENQAAGLAFFSGKSKDEMKALAAEMAAKQKATDEQVKGVLGDEKFKTYQQYKDSKPDREQLAMLRGSLKSTDHPLTDDQEQRVLDTLYTERKAYPWAMDYSNDKEWDPAKLDVANIDTFMQQQQDFDNHVAGKLGGILSPEQMTGVEKTNQQRRGITKFGLGMVKGLLEDK